MPLARQPWFAGLLLLISGFASLVYQTTWFREFRLVFGVSTYATAAVLAIFMAGLGVGSAVLGRVADRKAAPLAWYGYLELGIAASAAASPLLIALARSLYVSTGGVMTVGLPLATLIRLLLSVLVIGVPTFLMGGTLPAVARAVERSGDRGRSRLALMYGMNTLGAVAGVLVTTFLLLELLGNRQTLLIAALLNAIVAAIAIMIGSSHRESDVQREAPSAETPLPALSNPQRAPAVTAVLVAAGAVGFAFFLMELVWYRMLAPLLGGTTFTFGLILATALLGIGLGGGAYAIWGVRTRPTAATFALTCSLEAVAVILPFVLGDRLAVVAALLRPLGAAGFGGHILAWAALTGVVVFPTALIAGFQFPLLVALLGEGRDDVGRHVGAAYAWNTAGAILGALAGGFGLLPLLSATGAWRLVAVLLTVLGMAAAAAGFRRGHSRAAAIAIVVGVLALAGVASPGPSAVWRHTGIGAGRAPVSQSANEIRDWMNTSRRALVWERDGRESSIAVSDLDHRVFTINGKVDGSARGDDATQVMGGLVGVFVHPDPRSALVIGLGTGSTAGWLAAFEPMQRVDVVELEPAVVRVAEDFAAVNHGCMANPKVSIEINDAREVMLTTRRRYDIIFSEPSNPYRAGIASLYTREFYEAAAARLSPGGVFLQWVQGYEIDAETIRTVFATTTSVFGSVDVWRTTYGDLLLVCSVEPLIYDTALIATRLRDRVLADAVHKTWRVETTEGFLSHFVADDRLVRELGADEELNTDDRTTIEFGFARSVGQKGKFDATALIELAQSAAAHRPARIRGTVDWSLVDLNKWSYAVQPLPPDADELSRARHAFTVLYQQEDFSAAAKSWLLKPWRAVNTMELARVAEVLAEEGREEAEPFITQLRRYQPAEADAIEARLRFQQKKYAETVRLTEQAFAGWRRDPWALPGPMSRILETIMAIPPGEEAFAARLHAAIAEPFLAGQLEDQRRSQLPHLARQAEGGCGPKTMAAIRALEPHVPWNERYLTLRGQCYEETNAGSMARQARADWHAFQQRQPQPLKRR